MSIPVSAYGEAYPKDLPVGSVFKDHGYWALLVGAADGKGKNVLVLEGPHAGRLFSVSEGMAPSIAIVSPFTWYPAVPSGAQPVSSTHRTCALTFTKEGLRIIGAHVDRGDSDYELFGLDGSYRGEHHEQGPETRFLAWSAELVHHDDPCKSLGEIFSIKVGS